MDGPTDGRTDGRCLETVLVSRYETKTKSETVTFKTYGTFTHTLRCAAIVLRCAIAALSLR